MSHITLAQQGLAAIEAKDWDEALTKLSLAIQGSNNPAWLVARSKALVGLERFEEALGDANLAWHAAMERGKRTSLVEAHYRRAVAYFRMGQFANADCCCLYAMRLIKGFPAVEKEDPAWQWLDAEGLWKPTVAEAMAEAQDDEINKGGKTELLHKIMQSHASPQGREWRMASTLRIQILGAMQKLSADDPARKLTATLKPELKKLADVRPDKGDKQTKPAASTPQVPSDTPVRLQDFQNNTTISVSIFSKGVNKEKLQVCINPSVVRLDPIIYPNGDEKEFRLDLWGEIDPTTSKYTVTPNKVELSLAKKTAVKWPALTADRISEEVPRKEGSTQLSTTSTPVALSDSTAEAITKDTAKASANTQGPAYPTSARSGPKDWENVGADENSDDEGGKDVNHFFKKLFKNASPEQQRAMTKSFTESNGTSLSTDWGDVKDRTVDTVPPDGVEARKWE